MKISYKTDYALKTLLKIASLYGTSTSPNKLESLSSDLNIPHKFLEAVMNELHKGGFVKSKRGKYGGYFLNKKPNEIFLGDIIRHLEGTIAPIACIQDNYSDCDDINFCVLRTVFQEVTEAISKVIDNVSLQDLLEKQKKIQHIPDFVI
jgi:Rrf2 family transcriptional regulator, cysteine metabolism repressor